MVEDEFDRASTSKFLRIHPEPRSVQRYLKMYKNPRFSDHMLAKWVLGGLSAGRDNKKILPLRFCKDVDGASFQAEMAAKISKSKITEKSLTGSKNMHLDVHAKAKKNNGLSPKERVSEVIKEKLSKTTGSIVKKVSNASRKESNPTIDVNVKIARPGQGPSRPSSGNINRANRSTRVAYSSRKQLVDETSSRERNARKQALALEMDMQNTQMDLQSMNLSAPTSPRSTSSHMDVPLIQRQTAFALATQEAMARRHSISKTPRLMPRLTPRGDAVHVAPRSKSQPPAPSRVLSAGRRCTPVRVQSESVEKNKVTLSRNASEPEGNNNRDNSNSNLVLLNPEGKFVSGNDQKFRPIGNRERVKAPSIKDKVYESFLNDETSTAYDISPYHQVKLQVAEGARDMSSASLKSDINGTVRPNSASNLPQRANSTSNTKLLTAKNIIRYRQEVATLPVDTYHQEHRGKSNGNGHNHAPIVGREVMYAHPNRAAYDMDDTLVPYPRHRNTSARGRRMDSKNVNGHGA